MDRSNDTWLAHLRSGGPEQQAALLDLRAALLRGLRRSFAGDPGVQEPFLEDAVQDALLRILERLDQFEGRSRFVTWATSIAIRLAMTELRRRRWKDVSLEDLLGEGLAPAAPMGSTVGPGPVVHSAQRALVAKMYELIRDDLTERQRIALVAELRGMPQVEIGRRLGSKPNAVYKLTHDARRRLKRGLQEAGYRADDVHAAFAV